MTSTTTFDISALGRAIEDRDTEAAVAQYAPDAEVNIVDATTTPSSPRVLSGREAIQEWIADVNGRDMTHRISWSLHHEDKAALAEDCQYPDGVKVLCVTLLDVSDGLITRQLVSQSWDS